MKKLIFSAAVVSALMLGACGDSETGTTNETVDTESTITQTETTAETSTNTETEKTESNDDVYFKDGEAKLVDLKIKITDTKVIQVGEPGNEYGDKPVIAFWYDTTNLTGKDINPSLAWVAVFEVIQDNNPNAINKLEMGMAPDMQYLDTQMETIKQDGTVANAVAYELDDLETPVKLVARQGLVGDVLGEIEYPVK